MVDETEKDLVPNETETPQNEEVSTATETKVEEAVEKTTPEATEEVAKEESPQEVLAGLLPEEEDDDDWWKDDDEYSAAQRAELTRLYSSTLREFNENEIVTGTVVSVGDKEVVLNIGFKSEGVVPISEFRDVEDLSAGSELEVFIESVEDRNGQLILSRKRAKNLRTWERINESMEADVIMMGHVMRRTKGGFVVDMDGIEAFLPGSQIDVKPVRDFDAYVGRTMEFKVVKINHAYENVVVSHKILIEAKLEEQRKEILQNLEKGQVLEGTVKNMTNFGVFIDLGGVDGLLHITDISWGRINHPEEVLNLDEKVNVVVLEFDDAKKRISLGMKQLTPHPWDSLGEEIVEGSRVKGRVVTVADYGIFLEIMPGVEGLIHTSEMSWSQHTKNPTETFKVGSELEAVVLNIDREDRKMSLGLKQLQSDPWDAVAAKYPQGSRHSGLVRNMTSYGLFVELEEGVDGLVHISDLSWTKKYGHPSEYVKTGETLEVIVLDIDVANRRLSLGHKQLTEDVWSTFASIFTVGSRHKGTIKKIDSKGAVAELDYGVEGLIPTKHLKVEEGKPELKLDDFVEFVVIEFNKDAKRLVLSHTKAWRDEPEKEKKSSPAPSNKGRGKSKGKSSNQLKTSTTTLGDLDALVRLKEQMEAQEQGASAPAPVKKEAKKTKKKAPVVEEAAEEVVEATTEKVEAAAEEAVEATTEKVETAAEEVVEATTEKVEAAAEEAVEATTEEVEAAAEEVAEAVEETAETAEEVAEEVTTEEATTEEVTTEEAPAEEKTSEE
ncbi:MAG: 30S ribosomal protein S1 [Bacteroidota bacterium]